MRTGSRASPSSPRRAFHEICPQDRRRLPPRISCGLGGRWSGGRPGSRLWPSRTSRSPATPRSPPSARRRPSRGSGGSSSPASAVALLRRGRLTERTSGFLPKQARTTLAISLRLNGGYSALRSTMSRRTLSVSLRCRAVFANRKPSMPYSSKLPIRRWRVRSETPVSSARSGTELPKRTGWRMHSYSTCSGHQHNGSISCQSSVGSTRGRYLTMRFPLHPGRRRSFSRSHRVTQRVLPLSERRDDFAKIQKNATDGYLPPTV